MKSNSETIGSLKEAIHIFLDNTNNAPKNKGGYELMYRGHSSENYLLQPSIFRGNRLDREAQMIQELKRLSPIDFPNSILDIEDLIKMQHYGLPTRLLDFSLNPLVALYFACQTSKDEDHKNDNGEIIAFYEKLEPTNSFATKRFARLSSYDGKTEKAFQKILNIKDSSDASSPENTSQLIKKKIVEYYSKKYIFIPAIHNNERIRRQNGVFMFFGIDIATANPFEKSSFAYEKDDLEPQYDGMKVRIVVPKDVKTKILSDLDALGINHGFLFPELEHQAFYIDEKFLREAGAKPPKRRFRVLR
ncbi:MAG: FRG domain-containing protein [Lentisphaeria bacterium]|nr:FRG domain-containing protein [Lentisphaeria bacterium]